MIEIDIPGFGAFKLRHLVTDYNGTLALDGRLLPGVPELAGMLAEKLEIHVITTDTFGLAEESLAGLPVKLTVFHEAESAEAKLRYVQALDAETVVAIGNGRNDRKMLEAAAIGIAVIQKEGASVRTLGRADILTTGILDAFEILLHPKRLVATLKS